ncbi:P-loop containing nucleoside triphosphate hydrolase protein [Dioscorea alata]|uniref:P-loop containing nucleoside triphosphate hydrolase protein n=1 Tax=Dioscorea alata TaxID=55571 RepID=A0ACB7UCF1_DIOAL|nr:P-loop containing nucleoside triphosphate hydrolase protein [Dioscorea alata]
MMHLLGFRGSSRDPGGSPASVSRNPSKSSGSTSTPNTLGPARPLRLVYCDENGKFRMDPEAVAALHLVKGPIGVVSVCGRARQGKSFILNQLLGRSSGFQVAPTHRPCTKGLWMWSAPIKRTALDGTEYNLLLLDSEGIDAYDQTMGGIDEAALDRLSLVTEMTKHIRVRASGGKSTVSEIGQFSPIFVWLLRDFYLELSEGNQKITPRDYLELALRPVQGLGKDLSSKNEIRESIRNLFPDRECFALVRPLNKESDLQRLDQILLDELRPEFRSGLDALTKFIFERTRPKQVGATILTGPVLAGITQSFLDAINKGAVPTISSSWQSVEEAECRRAYDKAAEVYMASFDRTKPTEEAGLIEAHEDAIQESFAAFNAIAVGSGLQRMNYEKLLHSFCKKAFEDYKRTAFLEADLQCSKAIQNIENKLRAACHASDAILGNIIQVLDNLLTEYESSSHGPGKWRKLAAFLQQCLEGPILDLVNKQLDQIISERSALELKCRAYEDKLGLLQKQLEANERHRAEYLARYEKALSDKQNISAEYSQTIMNLNSKCSTLEERCLSLSKALEHVKRESSDWKTKYDNSCLELQAVEEKFTAQIAALESRRSIAEGRLAAACEQAKSAVEEASEWKRKYDVATGELKTVLEKSTFAQKRSNKELQTREDALRAEFSNLLARKEEEIKNLIVKFDNAENQSINLASQLKAAESKLKNHELEALSLRDEINELNEKLDFAKTTALSHEREARILEQEKNHLQEKFILECKKFDEADERCRTAEREVKRAIELADAARAEMVTAQKEKNEVQQLAAERLALIERAERHVQSLEGEKSKLMEEVEKLRQSETDVVSKAALLESRVEEREREIEEMLSQNNAQRSNTVQVLESLLATERKARAEANSRAEALSLQLQATQGKLDALHQELTAVRLNENALDGKLRTVSHGKRLRTGDYLGTDSVQDMDVDFEVKGRKRAKTSTNHLKFTHTDDGASAFHGDDRNQSQHTEETETEDYAKFTVLKLKQELTKHGFGAQLLQLKNPNKKDILALYEKLVLKKQLHS